MRVALAHGKYPARDLIASAMARRLKEAGYADVEVLAFSRMEDVLDSSLEFDAFVLYSNFGKRMGGIEGASIIRHLKPNAVIIGVTAMHPKVSRFHEAGAVGVVFLSGDEIPRICEFILKNVPRPGVICVKCRARPIRFVEGQRIQGETVWLYDCPNCLARYLIKVTPRTRKPQARMVSPGLWDELIQSGERIIKAADLLATETDVEWVA
jgi:hypothetical protein